MTKSYAAKIMINHKPERIFKAISQGLGDWWGPQDKIIDRDGIIFKVAWGEPWYHFKVLTYHENQEMIWECIDANQKIAGLQGVEKEWVGTRIHWQLDSQGDNLTVLKFTHEGLVPDFICFDFCSASWEHFLKESLINYLDGM